MICLWSAVKKKNFILSLTDKFVKPLKNLTETITCPFYLDIFPNSPTFSKYDLFFFTFSSPSFQVLNNSKLLAL